MTDPVVDPVVPTPSQTDKLLTWLSANWWKIALFVMLLFQVPAERLQTFLTIVAPAMTAKPVEKDKPVEVQIAPAPEKATPESDHVAAIDWKAIIDQLLPVIIDKLKPQPDPKPDPPPKPDPTPIPPTPPVPSGSKIVVSDENGKPLTAATVDAGALYLVTASTSGKVAWAKSSSGQVRVIALPDNRGFVFSLTEYAFVEFHLTDSSLSTVSLRITANHGPQPPPGPVDPVAPDPVNPEDKKPHVSSFRVIFVKESGSTLSAAQTAIPGAKIVRDYLFAKTTRESSVTGWREYDPQTDVKNEQPTMKALWQSVQPKLTTIPCIVVEVNGKAEILPYPANVDEAMTLLKKYGGS